MEPPIYGSPHVGLSWKPFLAISGVMLGIDWENGKVNANYYLGFRV